MTGSSVRLAVAAGVVLSLNGCSVKQPPPVSETVKEALPETTEVPEDFRESDAAAPGQVEHGWLKTLGDPELEALVAEAVKNNLSLRAAVASLDKAAGFATQAGAELKPAIALTDKGLSREGFAADATGIKNSGVNLNVSWELDIWGRVRAQAQAGELAFEAAQYQVEWAYQSVAAQTAKTWFLVTEARLQEQLAQGAVDLAQRTLEVVEAKHELGQVTNKEVALAHASLSSRKAAVRQARGGRQQAARALEVLLGRYPAAEIDGATDLVAVPPPIPIGLPSELLERRPDLIAAERAVAAEFSQIQSAKAARLPRIALTAGVGTSSTELTDIVSLGGDFWNVGANFVAPIFTGGALQAQVEIEEADQEAALANYGLAALKAFAEVEQGLSNETLLMEREMFVREALADAHEALRVAEAQFEVGRTDLLSVLQQQGQVISARVGLLNLRDQRLQQRVDLHLAIGGGFDAPPAPEDEEG